MVLELIDPIAGDTVETVHYVSCDFCFETACEDIWAGKRDEKDWREFYRLHPGLEVCCGNCLDGLDMSEGKPTEG
jgi:hypothetical protein